MNGHTSTDRIFKTYNKCGTPNTNYFHSKEGMPIVYIALIILHFLYIWLKTLVFDRHF